MEGTHNSTYSPSPSTPTSLTTSPPSPLPPTLQLADVSRALSVGEPLPSTRGAQPACYCAPEMAVRVLSAKAAKDGNNSPSKKKTPGSHGGGGGGGGEEEEDGNEAVPAHVSLDTWNVGLTLYELFSGGAPLFHVGGPNDQEASAKPSTASAAAAAQHISTEHRAVPSYTLSLSHTLPSSPSLSHPPLPSPPSRP